MKTLTAVVVLTALPLAAAAQDAVKVDAGHYKLLIDNAAVRDSQVKRLAELRIGAPLLAPEHATLLDREAPDLGALEARALRIDDDHRCDASSEEQLQRQAAQRNQRGEPGEGRGSVHGAGRLGQGGTLHQRACRCRDRAVT